MPNKALTILIADDQHLQRRHIETLLNRLGYHRLVPVQTFEEVQILTAIPAEPFDLLIINSGLAPDSGESLPQVRHMFVYDPLEPGAPADTASAVRVRLPGVPDSVNLEHFMAMIDPPEPTRGLRVVPWLRALSRMPAAGV
ncbi:chemotaxis protein CheY [Pseudomonas sp. PWP3-1b2]|uniref:chemotaxis protein CheY n=1 Tax=Pseudomonas sp. PWP3-1b2 TaxID=2804656 RepID=UPI003CF13067